MLRHDYLVNEDEEDLEAMEELIRPSSSTALPPDDPPQGSSRMCSPTRRKEGTPRFAVQFAEPVPAVTILSPLAMLPFYSPSPKHSWLQR